MMMIEYVGIKKIYLSLKSLLKSDMRIQNPLLKFQIRLF